MGNAKQCMAQAKEKIIPARSKGFQVFLLAIVCASESI